MPLLPKKMPKQKKSKEPLYRIEELGTNGWGLYEDCNTLTKDQCKEKYDNVIFRSGISPDRLRIVREQ